MRTSSSTLSSGLLPLKLSLKSSRWSGSVLALVRPLPAETDGCVARARKGVGDYRKGEEGDVVSFC